MIPRLQIARVLNPDEAAMLDGLLQPCREAGCPATGLAHNPVISRAVVRAVTIPVILAGGLHPGNVAAALQETGAQGVDVHSGVESRAGNKPPAARPKDPELVREFIRQALTALSGSGA